MAETQGIPIGSSAQSAPATWDLQPPFRQGQWNLTPAKRAETVAGTEPIPETLHKQGRRKVREKGARGLCPRLLLGVLPSQLAGPGKGNRLTWFALA